MTAPEKIVFLLEVASTLLDNESMPTWASFSGWNLATRTETATGKFSRRYATNSVMQIIWAPCNATV